MVSKLIGSFGRVRPGLIAAAAATDVATDLGALLVAILLAMVIVWGGPSVGTHSFRHYAK